MGRKVRKARQDRNQISENLSQRRYGSFAASFGTSPGGSEPQGGPFPEAVAKGKGRKVFKKKSCPNLAPLRLGERKFRVFHESSC
jgi:hypothetical protein